MNRAKVLDKYSIDVIDYELERSRINFKYNQQLEYLAYSDKDGYSKLCLDRDLELLELDLYLPFEESEPPSVGELDSVVPYYELVDNIVFQRWEVICDDKTLIKEKIEKLKLELSSSDYKVSKCSEAMLVGEPLPYDIVELRSDRQALREEVNALEHTLSKK